jgi:hypothetical protein
MLGAGIGTGIISVEEVCVLRNASVLDPAIFDPLDLGSGIIFLPDPGSNYMKLQKVTSIFTKLLSRTGTGNYSMSNQFFWVSL